MITPVSLTRGGFTISDALARLGNQTRKRCNAKAEWEQVLAEVAYVPVQYTNLILDYQLEYYMPVWDEFVDLSCVMYSGGRPVSVWPLTLSKTKTKVCLSSFEAPIAPPIFVSSASPKEIKNIIRNCQELLGWLCRQNDIDTWASEETSLGGEGASEWITAARTKSAHCSLSFDLFVNLKLADDIIRSHMRKSYRSLITAGRKKWSVATVGEECSLNTWQEVQLLHRAVSGRVTRSQGTWSLQLEQIKTGRAILVTVRSEGRKLVGAALFTFSKDEANYSIGIYDRTLSSEPLGHLVQHHAISELKSRGCIWYRLGGDSDERDTKQADITHFKRGFATHRIPVFKTKLSLPKDSAEGGC